LYLSHSWSHAEPDKSGKRYFERILIFIRKSKLFSLGFFIHNVGKAKLIESGEGETPEMIRNFRQVSPSNRMGKPSYPWRFTMRWVRPKGIQTMTARISELEQRDGWQTFAP
jgi:hypothetical protein